MKYIALYENHTIYSIEPVSGNSKVFTNKLSICDTKSNIETFLRDVKGFTQSEIDAKMPVEE